MRRSSLHPPQNMPGSAHTLPHHNVQAMVDALLIAHAAAARFKQRSHDAIMCVPNLRPHSLLQQLVHAEQPPRPVHFHKPAAAHTSSNSSYIITHSRQQLLNPHPFHVLLPQSHHVRTRSLRRQPAAGERGNSAYAAVVFSRHHLARACKAIRLQRHVLHFTGSKRHSNRPPLRRAVEGSANMTETSVQISARGQSPQLHVAAFVRPLKQHTHAAISMLLQHPPLRLTPHNTRQHPLPLHLNSSSVAVKQQVAAPHIHHLAVLQPHTHFGALFHLAAHSHTLQLQLRDAAAPLRNRHVPQRPPRHNNTTPTRHQRRLLGIAPVEQRPRRVHGRAQRKKRQQLCALRLQSMRLQGMKGESHRPLQPARVLRSSC